MKLYPFTECADAALQLVVNGHTIHQQFNCAGCGVKQTMGDKNVFHTWGKCEECGHVSDLIADGCNYLLIVRV